MKTTVISAYAVNPYKGSEDGTGWNMTLQVASDYKVKLITRKNNLEAIKKYMNENQDSRFQNIEVFGHDLAPWIMRLKKRIGERGYVLYYYLWQLFLPLTIKKLKLQFDLAHVLNFHSDSTPHFLWVFKKPVIWGPVGHHPKVARRFMKFYSPMDRLKDGVYNIVKWGMRNLDPFFRIAVAKSDKIIGINSSVQKAMGVANDKFELLPAVASVPVKPFKREFTSMHVLSVGRFTYMKGFDLTIKAYARFYESLNAEEQENTSLILVGKGEAKSRLQSLARDLEIDHKINWVEWVDKSEMENLYKTADVFLFPSHEGAGMVIPEAMSYGLPIVTLNNVGPGELATAGALKVDADTHEYTISSLAYHLKVLNQSVILRRSLSAEGMEAFAKRFTWESKGEVLKSIYRNEMQKVAKSVAVFHPSSELYGADRILVHALKAMDLEMNKVVYLREEGPLVDLLYKEVSNVSVQIEKRLPVIYRAIFTPVGIIKFVWSYLQFFFYLRNENRKHDFDLAYVNTLSCSFILPLLSFLKIKNFVHVHEIIENPRIIAKLTALFAARFSQKVVCVSNAVAENLKKYASFTVSRHSVPKAIGIDSESHSKIQILHNGIPKVNSPVRALNGKVNFYLFGRLMAKKGQYFLLDALKKVNKEKLAKSRFVLMGGPVPGKEHEVELLEQELKSLGLNGAVQIEGFKANITEAMESADVCLVPSMMKDPFPTTVLEAMSAGRPVITTNHGGAKEAMVENQTGFLINPGDDAMFAEKLEWFIDNKTMLPKFNEACAQHYQDHFTVNRFNQEWRKMVNSIL